jgi:hypothetical protein
MLQTPSIPQKGSSSSIRDFFSPQASSSLSKGATRKAPPGGSTAQPALKKPRYGKGTWRAPGAVPFDFTVVFERDVEKIKCTLCQTTMGAQKAKAIRHAESKGHKDAVKSHKGAHGNIQPHIEGRTTGFSHIKADVVTCAYFLTKHKKPYSDAPKLKELLQSLNCVDKDMVNSTVFAMSDTYVKQKVVRGVIRPFFLRELKSLLALCMAFTLMFDESTDVATLSKCVIYLNLAMPDGRRLVLCLSVADIKGADAAAIFTHVRKKLLSADVDADMKKLVSICTDGASVMRGRYNGAVKKLLDWVQEDFGGAVAVLQVTWHTGVSLLPLS